MTFEKFITDYQDVTPPLNFLILDEPVEVRAQRPGVIVLYAIVALATTSKSPDGHLYALAVKEYGKEFCSIIILSRMKHKAEEDPSHLWDMRPEVLLHAWTQKWFEYNPARLIDIGIRLERWATAKRQQELEQPK